MMFAQFSYYWIILDLVEGVRQWSVPFRQFCRILHRGIVVFAINGRFGCRQTHVLIDEILQARCIGPHPTVFIVFGGIGGVGLGVGGDGGEVGGGGDDDQLQLIIEEIDY